MLRCSLLRMRKLIRWTSVAAGDPRFCSGLAFGPSGILGITFGAGTFHKNRTKQCRFSRFLLKTVGEIAQVVSLQLAKIGRMVAKRTSRQEITEIATLSLLWTKCLSANWTF
jgi:hypothetical protein